MAGFSKGNGVIHGFTVADLADQDHIGRLAQRVLQRDFVGLGIHADLSLGYDAVPVIVNKFDRVFDGNDMTLAVFIAVAHHGRQRC